MNALPKAIQQQLAQVEELEQLAAPAAVAPVAEEPQVTEPEPQPAAPAPADEPVVQPEPKASAGEPVKTEDADYWKKRFEVVQGKYNAEVPQLYAQVKELNGTVQQLLEREKTAEAAKPESRLSEEPLVTSRDEDEFGKDLIDLARRVSRAEVQELVKTVQHLSARIDQLTPLREQMGTVMERQAVSDADRFLGALAAKVPDFERINADPRWIEWLSGRDPGAAVPRQANLSAAENRFDAVAVAEMFQAWKAAFEPETPAKSKANAELQRQVAPSKPKASAAQPQGERMWTLAEYSAAFDPRNRSKYSDAELSQLQAEADRAYAEGRILP